MTTYTFPDGVFTFWTVSWANGKWGTFRVREDRDPLDRAKEKINVGFDRLAPADEDEIYLWFSTHIGFEGIKNPQ